MLGSTPNQQMRIDLEHLTSLVEDDAELLRELAALFAEDSTRQLAKIFDAIRTERADLWQRSAHALKGSVSNFALIRAYEFAAQLELATTAQQAGQLAAALETEVVSSSLELADLASRWPLK